MPPHGIRLRVPEKDGEPASHAMPLSDPVWLAARDASHMLPDDPVTGVLPEGGRPRALPWWVMKNHHAANLLLDGEPVLVTLCELCSGSAAFTRRLEDGRSLSFQLIGAYKGTHILADYETVSLWASFEGYSLFGSLQGKRLPRLPSYLSTWQEWVEHFPDTLVTDGEGEPRDGHGSKCFPGSLETPMGKLDRIDPRLRQNELMLGVDADGRSRAYPLSSLTRAGAVVNDQLGDTPIAVLSLPDSWMAIAFERRLDGQVLSFERRADGSILDRATGSAWSLAGRASSGPLAGARLRHARSRVEEWYVWAAYHPDTDIFDASDA